MKKAYWIIGAMASVVVVIGIRHAMAAGEITVANSMPVVVKTVPQSGDTAVTPGEMELRVTFSKDMRDGGWSWTQIAGGAFPEIIGDVHYLDDKRTCVVKVKLEPNTTYVSWLNSAKFGNFRDTDGRSAHPYLLIFETGSAAE